MSYLVANLEDSVSRDKDHMLPFQLHIGTQTICFPSRRPNEPCHEIMVLFVLCKLSLQTRMRSHPFGVRCQIFGRTQRLPPYFLCANSEGSGETARKRRLPGAFAGRLCGK